MISAISLWPSRGISAIFAAKTNYFNVGSRIFDNLTGSDKEYYKQFTWSFYNPNYNTATQAEQLKNLVNKALSAGLEYGT